MKIDSLIPFQYTGKATNTSSSIEGHSNNEAQEIFLNARNNLLHINLWHELAGEATALFQLTDSNGVNVDRQVGVGDYIKIDIPGPGSYHGEGYDWVRVEEVEEQIKHSFHVWVAIKVRPTAPPIAGENHTAHFFADEATSSFVVERRGRIVTASVYGRNEKINDEHDGIFEMIRNTIVAVTALLGLSKQQWKSLVKGILKTSK